MKHIKLSITIFFSMISYSFYAQTWETVGIGTGMNASVSALLSDSATNTLITAGQFTKADVIPSQTMIRWNGNEWHPMDSIPSFGTVSGKMVDTVNNLLNIGGYLWNGTTWSQAQTSGNCLCMYKGELYVGTSSTVKKWTGSNLVNVGVNYPSGSISDLVVFQGDLYACGSFWQLNDQTPAQGIAKFDGNDWSPVGYPLFSTSYGNDLVASDSTLYYCSTGDYKISTYDGNTWTTIASNYIGGHDMGCYNGDLYVAGIFSSIENIAVNNIAKWNGQVWSPVGAGVTGGNNWINALAVYNGELYVGGHFTTAGGVSASNIASWNGTSWSVPPQGLSSWAGNGVSSLIEFNCELMIRGSITGTVGVTVNHIAQYNGTKWDSLGGGTGGGINSDIYALTKWNGKIYAGGTFTSIGNVSANKVAVWNGTNYSALGTGIGPGEVYALANYNGELYVGGNFQTAGSDNISYIAKWNGVVWDTVGGGLDERVYALTVYNGELYAGGIFSASGSQVLNGIAKWNGTVWMPLAGGTDGNVKSLCVHNNNLYAGGDFSSPGNNIAKWDGISWTTLGTGTNSDVMALTSINGRLYAGGQFFSAGGNTNCKRIAQWNDTIWQALAWGVNFSVRAISSYNNTIFIGGNFTAASNQTRSYIAKWGGTALAPVAGFNNCKGDICNNGCIIFTDVSLNSPTTFQWSFPGGLPSSSAAASPHVCYNTPGTYSVTLIVSNTLGSDTTVQNITIFPVPAAPVITLFGNDLVSSSVTGNQWYFNNKIITGAVSQTYTPVQNGNYSVSVTNTYGCSSTSQTFNNSPPTANFTTSASKCEGQPITLTDNSTYGPTSWNWTMTGGTPASSTLQNPSVTYSTSGTYTVTLISTNQSGASSPLSYTVTVNTNPTVAITYNGSTTFCQGGAITLIATSGMGSYLWSNNATTQSITVSSSQNYSVTVTNGNGCSATSSATNIIVNPLPTVALNLSPSSSNVCVSTSEYALTGGSPSGGTYSGVGVNSGTFNPAIAGLGFHTIYYSYSGGNNCTNIDTAQIHVKVCTGIKTIFDSSPIIIFPNPNNGTFIIEAKENDYRIIITNVLGEIISQFEIKNQKSEIDLSKQPNGIYFINIKTEKGTAVQKLIINK